MDSLKSDLSTQFLQIFQLINFFDFSKILQDNNTFLPHVESLLG